MQISRLHIVFYFIYLLSAQNWISKPTPKYAKPFKCNFETTNNLPLPPEILLRTAPEYLADAEYYFLFRVSREQPVDDFKWLQTYVQEWQKVKDKITDALQKMKVIYHLKYFRQ